MPTDAKMNNMENEVKKIDLRAVIADEDDLKKWDEIKKYFGIKKDSVAIKSVIRKFYDMVFSKTAEAIQ